MRRFFLLLVFWSVVVKAQPVFEAQHCFQMNDSAAIGFAVYVQSFDSIANQTGPSYAWDFSGAGWSAPVTPYLFQPSIQSLHTGFHQTEINEYAALLFGRDLFYSYSAGNDTLYLEGLYASANYFYRPRIPYLNFPLNYSDSILTYTKQYAIPTQPTFATGSVTRYWIYDGFGTVNLPYGTASGVYRIRTRQIDSVYVTGAATITDELIWFRQSDGIPVLRFLNNAGLISAYFASVSGSPSSLLNADLDEPARVWPNPVSDLLFANVPGAFAFALINIQGNVVHHGLTRIDGISLSALPPGFYTIRFDTMDGKSVYKVIIKK